MICDLHNHSVFSDGSDQPETLIALAESLGLGAVALTDHNSVDGLPRFLAAAEHSPVIAVPGIEFSTGWREGELHILALFVRERDYDAVRTIAAEPDRLKRESNLDLARALNEAGYAIDYTAIEAATPNGRVNRSHFATALVRAGYFREKQDAFDTILRPGGPCYTPPKRLSAIDTIRFIRSIGAVAILAHPFHNHSQAEIEEFLAEAVPAGLDGMETRYSTFTPAQTADAMLLADRWGLLQSGGSDYHGTEKADISMGTGRGNLAVPMDFYHQIRALAEERQS